MNNLPSWVEFRKCDDFAVKMAELINKGQRQEKSLRAKIGQFEKAIKKLEDQGGKQ